MAVEKSIQNLTLNFIFTNFCLMNHQLAALIRARAQNHQEGFRIEREIQRLNNQPDEELR